MCQVEEKLGEVGLYQKTFSLTPTYSPGRHWVAIEDEAKANKTQGSSHSRNNKSWFVVLNSSFNNFDCKIQVPFSVDCWCKDTCPVSPRLAPTVLLKERSLFMIKVLYFVQVKVSTRRFSRDLLLKVPFVLAPNN